jgi:2',3'-cyclic-nucleotide 2'-phosphodiesterase
MPDERLEAPAVVLMIGDIVGPPGLRALFQYLPSLKKSSGADLVIANGENALKGFGLGAEEAAFIFTSGVDIITSGNHIWERKEAAELLESEKRLLRPANYPPGLPGRGWIHIEGRHFEWVVVNLQGREELFDIDCPFRGGAELVSRARREHPSAFIVVDFHAETTEEKEALAWNLDGLVSVVAGTHTHIQTADERILPKGTGYITDLGMTGPIDSIIGVKKEICIKRSLSQIPYKMETAEGEAAMAGAIFTIDAKTRRCASIKRFYIAATTT